MVHKLKKIDPDLRFRVLYLLEEKSNFTQRDLAENAQLTSGFLRRKMGEYNALKKEIDSIVEKQRYSEGVGTE